MRRMKLSMHDMSVEVFVPLSANLAALLEKGRTFAAARKIEPGVLLNARLAPDMFPLSRQVQIATDHAKRGTARLAGVEAPVYEDSETTFPQLKARIDKTVAFINGVKPAQIEGAETREITLKLGGNSRTLTGQAYLLHNALPNFFFHATTAYDILRHCGVEIGKGDYLGQI